MGGDEIVIATIAKQPLVASFVGEWKKQGNGWPDALVLTWTIMLGDTTLDVIDGETGKPALPPLDGLEARGWVKPTVEQLPGGIVQLQFDVFLGAACSSIRWRVDANARRIQQWTDDGVTRGN